VAAQLMVRSAVPAPSSAGCRPRSAAPDIRNEPLLRPAATPTRGPLRYRATTVRRLRETKVP